MARLSFPAPTLASILLGMDTLFIKNSRRDSKHGNSRGGMFILLFEVTDVKSKFAENGGFILTEFIRTSDSQRTCKGQPGGQ